MIKKKIKYLLIICLWISPLCAVGEAGAIFLLIAPGAGPAGTGEAQVAKSNDVYASYYNPAGLGFLKGREVAGMHVNWLPNLASDLFYEFMAYRHYIDGLGSVGGHVIFLNLGEQIGMDEQGNPTSNWTSFMAAGAGSFGTKLSETSSIGFNFKIFHQKLSDFTAGSEDGQGYSTDFGFDIGYLKKFRQTTASIKIKKQKKLNHFFDQLTNIYNRQNILNDEMQFIFETDRGGYDFLENQNILLEDLETLREKSLLYRTMDSYSILDGKLVSAITDVEILINSFSDLQVEEVIPSTIENFQDSVFIIMDRILFSLVELETVRKNILLEVETEEIQNIDDKFNFGFSISNIGPTIDFVDVDQADPSPTNMRLGIFLQLYNDDYNKVNFLFDANKLLVTRYPMMDWDGDGLVGGYDEFGQESIVRGEYNANGKKEYDSKGYIDDPWYLALFTAWLDDWYLGGDIDYNDDSKIGGWNWDETMDGNNGGSINGKPDPEELVEDEEGVYNNGNLNDKVEIEKGSGENRSFTRELEEMIYNVGLEYWYTDAFALRAGYIYDYEGKVFNPTFGAGIRLLQYGFDFGYTAGDQGHPKANTMFFSINIEI